MKTLRVVDMKIPEHAVVGDVGLRVALVAAIHGGKLDGITNEEDRNVVEDEVLDSLLRVELRCPPSNIANRVARTLLSSNCRDSAENRRLLAHLGEELGVGQVRDVFQNLKLAKCACRFGMDAPKRVFELGYWSTSKLRTRINPPLRNSLPCEMSEDLNGLGVAQHDKTAIGLAVAHLLDASRVVARLP